MTESLRILVGLLAQGDAVWLPLRDFDNPRGQNRCSARRDFPRSGVPWHSHAATEAARKAAQRVLEALAKNRLVELSRPRRVKVLSVRLSDAADSQTRAVCGLPGLLETWWTMRELEKYSKRRAKLLTDLWVGEHKFIGDSLTGDGRKAEIVTVELMFLPALVRGWVDSNADIRGRVSYMLTAAGWAWLKATPKSPDNLIGDVDADAEAVEMYNGRLATALARLDSAQPLDARNIGIIPLTASPEGLRIDKVTPK